MNVVHIEAGAGEPVRLLHGYPQSASCWRHQIPALAEHHRVIAADWPGFGRAEPPDTPPTYDAEVERIGRLADSFGLDRFNLVAHDFGGFLGLGYAQRHPDRVMRFALPEHPGAQHLSALVLPLSLGQRSAAIHAPALLRRLPLRTATSRCAAPVPHAGLLRRASGRRVSRLGGHAARQADLRRLLHQLSRARGAGARRGTRTGRLPTAIIWGDRDRYIPFSTARELAERIPGATLTQLTGGDHYIMEERPDEVTAALLELLARRAPFPRGGN